MVFSWSSLSGLKGVKPPEAFGERSQDWSLGHAGDEGPHLAMTGISWSSLGGLKGVKPPVEFAEKTRDGSSGHAGNESPHLAMTGSSGDFSRDAAPVWVFSRGTTASSGSHSCGAREVMFPMRVARGSASLLSSHGRGIGPQDVLKKDSRGLSRVEARKPGVPGLVPQTAGSFSGCL